MYLLAAVALASALVSGVGVWKVQDWRYQARESERLEMQAKEQARKADRVDTAAKAHEEDKKEIQIQYRTVTKEIVREVEKPVYRNVCIGPDGVRILSDLIDGKDPGQLEGAVPTPGKAD